MKIVLAIIVSILLPIANCFAIDSRSVETFLGEQSTIRILTDAADGLGNQSASANLVIRLRAMGYKGKFEFIYPVEAMSKIAILFDLPAILPDSYEDSRNNVEFIKLNSYLDKLKHKQVEEVTLGMTGVFVVNFCDYPDDGSIEMANCNNYANVMRTNYFVRLSPFITGDIKDYPTKSDTSIYIKNLPEPIMQMNSDNKFIVMPVATLEQAKAYLANDVRGQALIKQKPALATLIAAHDNGVVNIFPVYGYHVQIGRRCDNEDNNCRFNHSNEILQIILGARYAQWNGSEEYHKPLIIPVFYNYLNEAAFLQSLIHGEIWNSISEPGAQNLRALLNQYDLSSHFVIADADDPAAPIQIDQLKNNDIMLLSMGSLPKIVFDGLYNHTSNHIWPQVREGANTFNSLVLTGKPHLRCSDDGWEIGFNLVKDDNLRSQLTEFYYGDDSFCKNIITPWNDVTIKMVGNFILDAGRADSALSAYFNSLRAEALKPENDRIYFALDEIINQLS